MIKKKWVPLVAVLAGSLIISYCIVSMGADFLGLRGIASGEEDIVVKIVDTGPKAVAQALKKQKVIKNKAEFLIYQDVYRRLKKDAKEYQTGEFSFSSAMSYNSIIRRLTMQQLETVSVRLLEGLTEREIAKELEKNGVCKADEFLKVLAEEDFDFWFLKEIPQNEFRTNRFEGYLLPDTYEFYKGEAPANVAKKMFKNFDKKIARETKDKVAKSGFSLDEVIILASIVQKEEGGGEFAPRVASVFLNRINNQVEFSRLESDVTIDYVEKDIKPYLTHHNQELYDAYNTYKCSGLPVGPVSNPGAAAIDAVLNPQGTGYYYFLTDKSGKFYWAKTFEEHKANQCKAARA